MAVGTGVYRVTGRNEIFILENNEWRYVPNEQVLFNAGYSWADVQVIPIEEWCKYEVGSPMPAPGWPTYRGYCPHKDWYISACAVTPPPPPVYTCPHCPATFGSQADLDAHITQEHPVIPPPPPPNGNGVRASIPMIAWSEGTFGSAGSLRSRYQTYKDMGINCIIHGRHPEDYKNDPAAMARYDQVYTIAAEYGIKVIWYVDNRSDYKNPNNGQMFVERYKNFSACAGWYYADEPKCWHTFKGYTIPVADRSHFPYISTYTFPSGGHGQALMLYNKIRGQDNDIANHPAFAVWDKGFDWKCNGGWISIYFTIYTPGGKILDVGSVDVYPNGNNWSMLNNNIQYSKEFTNGDGFAQLGKGMIPCIDAWTDGAAYAPREDGHCNLVNQCIRWEAKYPGQIKAIGFFDVPNFMASTTKGAKLREQIKEVARFYGWQERPDEVITPQTIIHSCNVKISYQVSSFAENNEPLTCLNCGMALGVEGIRGSEEIVEVPEVITPHIITCVKCGSQLKLSVSSIGEKNTEQFCPVCGEPAD